MFKALARPGIVPVITPEAPMGDSGPVTIAGDIAQKIAEFLSGLVIMQLLRKGMPIMMATPHEVFDQKTSAVSLAISREFRICMRYRSDGKVPEYTYNVSSVARLILARYASELRACIHISTSNVWWMQPHSIPWFRFRGRN